MNASLLMSEMGRFHRWVVGAGGQSVVAMSHLSVQCVLGGVTVGSRDGGDKIGDPPVPTNRAPS